MASVSVVRVPRLVCTGCLLANGKGSRSLNVNYKCIAMTELCIMLHECIKSCLNPSKNVISLSLVFSLGKAGCSVLF